MNGWTRFLYKFTYFSALWYRITMAWSKNKKVRLPKYNKVEDIPKAFRYGKDYRYDEFFGTRAADHLTHPTELQSRINKGEKLGDCDDHAIYWCTALKKSGLAQKVWFAFYAMEHEETKEQQAHAVCVFADKDNNIFWADYRNPRKLDNVKDFMHQSARGYKSIPIVGVIWLIEGVKSDDTPVFGKITRILL